MCERFKFVGTVRDGVGGAARDTRKGIYLPDMLGFDPYPGSLNLDVWPTDHAKVLAHPFDFAVHYASTRRFMWHAFTADGHPCMVQWHEKMPVNVLEIFAPHHLRSRFGLANGTPVTIRLAAVAEQVDAPDSNSGSLRSAGSSPAGGTREESTMSEQDELNRLRSRLKVYRAAIDTHRQLTHPDHRTIMDTALYALTIDNEGYGDD